jgi:hypothetical protein
MLIKSVIALVTTSALAMKLVHHLSRKQQQRRLHHEGRQQREEVSRWEAEGGNLPEPQLPAKAGTEH